MRHILLLLVMLTALFSASVIASPTFAIPTAYADVRQGNM